jgi:signal peptidase I
MDPTFETGQYLIVDELTFRFSEPERGQVIIMKYPKNLDTFFIKRIIGLPGETVKIKDGKVTIINKDHPQGLLLDEDYVSSRYASHDDHFITLGSTQYFVMGDNRAQSSDSRSWGALERKLIVGRPLIRLLPVSKIDLLPGKIPKGSVGGYETEIQE